MEKLVGKESRDAGVNGYSARCGYAVAAALRPSSPDLERQEIVPSA
jgi:hypothetical protein